MAVKRELAGNKMKLAGKEALVTGANRGIGRATALALAEAGLQVAISARNGEALSAVQREIEKTGARCLAEPADAGSESDWQRLLKAVESKLGKVDVLVNNAGIYKTEAVSEHS